VERKNRSRSTRARIQGAGQEVLAEISVTGRIPGLVPQAVLLHELLELVYAYEGSVWQADLDAILGTLEGHVVYEALDEGQPPALAADRAATQARGHGPASRRLCLV
jgi:hypothetical protein